MGILMHSAFDLIPDAIIYLRQNLSNMATDLATDGTALLGRLQYVFPVGLFVISIIIFEIACFGYTRQVNRFGSLLLGFPKQNKRDCMKSVRRIHEAQDSTLKSPPTSQSGGGNSLNVAVMFNITFTISFAGSIVAFYGCLANVNKYNAIYYNMNSWVFTMTGRKSHIVGDTMATLLAILKQNSKINNRRGLQYNYLDEDRLLTRIQGY
jgi:hypothetical protein